MTKLTDEAVKALLDGATPGAWRADGEPWNRVVWSSADNRVCFMAHSSGLNDARDTATSNLVAAAPDLARALLASRAELARVKADAAAAQALMVERAAEVCDDLAIGYAKHKGVPGALHDAARDIRALSAADGLAAVEALRERAKKAEQERDRIDQWRETAIVERDTYSEERDAAEGRVAALTEALRNLVGPDCMYDGRNIIIPAVNHGDAIRLVAEARATLAPTPTDPGDDWTWNERLGWIGPDGKPADPRRRG